VGSERAVGHYPVVIPRYGIGKENGPVFTPALIIAQAKIDELHAEAAANRLAKENRSGRSRLAVAMSNLRAFFSLEGSNALPKLTDYPYRS
jgi:hypothetical protein